MTKYQKWKETLERNIEKEFRERLIEQRKIPQIICCLRPRSRYILKNFKIRQRKYANLKII